jgi:regulation of enolase protein 1 (concanavalin A-like superfamily)
MQRYGAFVRALGLAVIVLGSSVHDTMAQTSSVPPPWSAQDVGNPAQPGSAIADTSGDGTQAFTITADGKQIGATADQFYFIYQQVTGDVDLMARLDDVTPATNWSKAGVMIRASLDANAAHAFAFVSASNGVGFQRRTTSGGSTSRTMASGSSAPYWVRLRRQGSIVAAFMSPDGATWTSIGTASIPLNQSAYVGIAVASQNATLATTAKVSEIALDPLSVPPPQSSQDIGSPAVAGSASYQSGTYTISGGGTDINGSGDQFQFVYEPVTGDVNVATRVSSLTGPDGWSNAGVMVRETLTADSPHAYAFVSTGNGLAFRRRLTVGGPTVNTGGGTGTAPAWLRIVRTGTNFDAYQSADGQAWTLIGSETIPMADTVYVGIAVAAHSSTAMATAVVDSFTLTQPAPTNQPPVVTLTAPASGSTFTAPASITLQADALDSDGHIARVEFYADATLVATTTTAPYTATWSSVPAGTYTLTALAFDDAGAQTRSAGSAITVTAVLAPPRAVEFTASVDHDTLVTSYQLDIFASGADPNTATPVASVNLGKPTPDASNTITVDESAFFTALAPGSYQATVSSIGDGGSSRSGAVAFTR